MNNTTRNLITLFLLFLVKLSIAQVVKHQRIILKNGSEYKGILLRNSNDTIQLVTEEDHVLLFQSTEVDTIISSPKFSKLYNTAADNRKWYCTTNFFTDYSTQDNYFGFALGIETFVGIKHHSHFQNGIGIGIAEDWGWNNFEPFIGHIALQNRANLFKTGSTPFISYEPSFIIPIKNNRRESSIKRIGHNLDIGYRFYRPKKGHSFNVSAGVRRRVNEYFDYIPGRPGRYESAGYFPTYTMVIKLGWQL
jgi:hypothetical protein